MIHITANYSATNYPAAVINPDKRSKCADKNISLCARLTSHQRDEMSAFSTFKKYSAGQLIFTEGKPSTHLGTVISGIVKIYKLLDDGRQQIVALAFPGDMLGNIMDAEYNYFAEAVDETQVCLYQTSWINSFAENNSALYLSILDKTNRQLNKSHDWLLLLGRKTAKEKLATFLMLLAVNDGDDAVPALTFKVPLKRQEIADFLGLTIETISRTFSNLKNKQVVREQAGHILTITDYSTLKSMV